MKKKNINILISLIPFVFYTFFSLFDGVVWCVDSPSYTYMSITREPLYPLFLWILRTILNKNNIYLNVAILIQGLFTAYSVYSIASYLRKEYKLNNIFYFLIEIIFIFVSLLSRFVAKRGSMYSNCILSESIAYPMFMLFFRYLIDYVINENKNTLIYLLVLSFLLISTRKQMYLTLMLVVLVLVYKAFMNKRIKSYLINLIIICALVITGTKLFDFVYTSLINNVDTTHTSSNRFITTVIYYCAKDDYIDLINDEETKEIYGLVYTSIKEQNLLKHNKDNWYDRATDFCNSYDAIQLENMWPIEKAYAINKYNYSDKEAEIYVDKINNKIIYSLIIKELPTLFLLFIDNILLGLMTTVSAANAKLKTISFFLIFSYLFLLLYLLIKTKFNKFTELGIITFICIMFNVAIVSAVIFPQTRYTFYCMGLFYTSGLLMLYRLFTNRKENNNEF